MHRALATLIALGSDETVERGGLGVVRVAEIIGGDKSQVSRMLRTLAESGLVERDPQTRSYRLGWQLFALAARAGDRRLLEAATPVLARLVRDLGERVSLSVLRDAEVLTIFSESPPHAVQTVGWVGRTVPAYCTSSGRALLTDHRPEELSALFADNALRQLGPNTPTDVDELYRRILLDRALGHAVVDEEFEPGLVAVAAPVRDVRGRVVAAVNVSAPKFRLGSKLRSAGSAVEDAAAEITRLLGQSAGTTRRERRVRDHELL